MKLPNWHYESNPVKDVTRRGLYLAKMKEWSSSEEDAWMLVLADANLENQTIDNTRMKIEMGYILPLLVGLRKNMSA